eukprot:scpid16510/ scgid5925/ 
MRHQCDPILVPRTCYLLLMAGGMILFTAIAPRVHAQTQVTVSIDSSMTPEYISSRMANESAKPTLGDLAVYLTSENGTRPFTEAQFEAIYTNAFVYIIGNDTDVPTPVHSTLPVLMTIRNGTVHTLARVEFVNCSLAVTYSLTPNVLLQSMPFVDDVSFVQAGLSVNVSSYSGKPLNFSNVLFANASASSALGGLRIHATNTSQGISVQLSNSSFSHNYNHTPFVLQGDWLKFAHLSLTNVLFEGNVIEHTSQHSGMPSAVHVLTPTFTAQRIEIEASEFIGNGQLLEDGTPYSSGSGVVDIGRYSVVMPATSNSSSNRTAQPSSMFVSGTLFEGNFQTPLVAWHLDSVIIQSTSVIGNTVQLQSNVTTVYAAAGVVLAECTTIQINGSVFEGNSLGRSEDTATPGEGVLRVAGGLLIVTEVSANVSVSIENCAFLNNTASASGLDASASGGGGMAVLLKNSQSPQISITQSLLHSNTAAQGGGLFVMATNTTGMLRLNITCGRLRSDCGFNDNNAVWHQDLQASSHAGAGGAVYVQADMASVIFHGVVFDGNGATTSGGAVCLHGDVEGEVVSCTFRKNTATVGAGLTLHGSGTGVTDEYLQFISCSFQGNTAVRAGTLAAVGAQAMLSGCKFTDNINSALFLHNSRCTCEATLMFSDNTGLVGAGILLVSSQVVMMPGAVMRFQGNIAMATGGGIHAYSIAEDPLVTQLHLKVGPQQRSTCFLDYNSSASEDEWNVAPDTWQTRLVFEDNIAGLRGASVYANNPQQCAWWDGALNNPAGLQWLQEGNGSDSIAPALCYSSSLCSRYLSTPGPVLDAIVAIPEADMLASLQHLSTLTGGGIRNSTQTIETNATFASDPIELFILSSQQAAAITALPLSNRCAVVRKLQRVATRSGDTNGTAVLDAVPGVPLRFLAVACDVMNDSVNATLFISSTATISSCTADGYCRHGDDEITGDSNRGQLRTVGTATVRLDASTQLTEDVMFAGLTPTRSSALTLFQASLLGVGVSVTAGFRVRMAGCLPGYVWQPNEAQHTTSDTAGYTCTCLHAAPQLNPASLVQSCSATALATQLGYWAMPVQPGSGTSVDAVFDGSIHFYPCPLGFCHCSTNQDFQLPVHTANCQFTVGNPSALCSHNRTGKLCSVCPNGTASIVNLLYAQCEDVSLCTSSSVAVGVSILVILVGVILSLFLEISISGDTRAILLFYSMWPMLLYDNDVFLMIMGDHVTYGSGLWSGSLHRFSKLFLFFISPWSMNSCWRGYSSAMEGIARGYLICVIVVGFLLLSHLLYHVLRLCRVGLVRGLNIYHGTMFLFFVLFQWILLTSASLLRSIEIDGERVAFYDATLQFAQGAHRAYVAVAIATLVILLMICGILSLVVFGWNPIDRLHDQVQQLRTAMTVMFISSLQLECIHF